MSATLWLTLLCVGVGGALCVDLYSPEQVHIATGSFSEMTVVWNTGSKTPDSIVVYGKTRDNLTQVASGSYTNFTDGGSEKRVQCVHTVILSGLDSNTTYYYMVGSKVYGFSDIFSFKTWPAGDKWSPSLAVYGDLGNTNAKSLPSLEFEAMQEMYHAVLHVGDFAYNMASENARVGDEFMRQIEPLASRIPYMTCPGNHEVAYNFSNYKHRFHMPGDINQRMYYSFKMGPVRFISTSTEYLYITRFGWTPIMPQYYWLKKELEDANKPENRAKQPWVIVFGHRPMYCTNNDKDDCTHYESILRVGMPEYGIPGWEKLLYDNGVDVAIWAHEHSYERLWPIYNRMVKNGSYEKPYTNPTAPVHIITGSAGCYADHDPFKPTDQPWSAFRTEDYGYTRLKVFNATHLHMEQVSIDKGGKVLDEMMLIKDRHGSYPYDPRPIQAAGDGKLLYEKWKRLISANSDDLP